MTMHRSSALSGASARPKGCPKSRLDSEETATLGERLWETTVRSEVPALALMSKVVPRTMNRQLRETDPTRLLADVVITHMARLDRETALDLFEQWLDAARVRVRPQLSDARQIVLFRKGPRDV